MATVVENPDSIFTENRGRRRGWGYPWGTWFDGQCWKLVRGEDFKGSTKTVMNNGYLVAKKRGVNIRVRIDGDVLYVQAIGPRTPAEPATPWPTSSSTTSEPRA